MPQLSGVQIGPKIVKKNIASLPRREGANSDVFYLFHFDLFKWKVDTFTAETSHINQNFWWRKIGSRGFADSRMAMTCHCCLSNSFMGCSGRSLQKIVYTETFCKISAKFPLGFPAVLSSREFLGSVLAERIFGGFYFSIFGVFSRILSPDFFLLISVGKSAQKNPPGKSSGKILSNVNNRNLRHISAEGPNQEFQEKL